MINELIPKIKKEISIIGKTPEQMIGEIDKLLIGIQKKSKSKKM